MEDYELFLTIKPDENTYISGLADLVFSSYVESFELQLLEAKLKNTPIIAADCFFQQRNTGRI